MANKDEEVSASTPAASRDAFAASLERRRRAAQGLEQDLLTEVPLLYGAPGRLEPHGDPGIVLARLHQKELVRRNGGGIPDAPVGRPGRVAFRRAVEAAIVVVVLLVLFG